MHYDYLVVGSGLYGSVFAHEAKARGKSVLVVDKRPNVAGNIYTEEVEGIPVHKYGAHIFHTNNRRVWNYITRFAQFNRFTNSPIANYKGNCTPCPSICIPLTKCGGWRHHGRRRPESSSRSGRRASPSLGIWRNRPSPWWAGIFLRN